MSDDIKKLLSIMSESTTAGAIAPTAGGMGNSMLKRPKDTIFAAEEIDPRADSGLEEAPKVVTPANFGNWENPSVIGKATKKKNTKLKEGTEPEQEKMDRVRRGDLEDERNAGLDEPDEFEIDADDSKDFGTWHFKFESGNIVKKDGKPVLAASMKQAEDIVDHASKRGITIEIVDGAPELSESKSDKFGPDYQYNVKLIGQMAKQGKRKTVWDPVKRVYKTVPVNPSKENTSEGTWDGTGEQDMAAAIASDGIDSQDAQTEKQISLSEAEITEEMIADRLKGELALLKKGQKKDNSITKKPADKEVQTKTSTKKDADNKSSAEKKDKKTAKKDSDENK